MPHGADVAPAFFPRLSAFGDWFVSGEAVHAALRFGTDRQFGANPQSPLWGQSPLTPDFDRRREPVAFVVVRVVRRPVALAFVSNGHLRLLPERPHRLEPEGDATIRVRILGGFRPVARASQRSVRRERPERRRRPPNLAAQLEPARREYR